MAGKYASATDVGAERSRAEIERTLSRYGATQFMYGWDERRAALGFEVAGRQVRFVLPLPDPSDPSFARTPTGRPRAKAAAATAFEQEVRQRWRALALVIKAKLEAVETGIVGFEQEFLAHLVLPDGATVGDTVAPRLVEAYESGAVPALLPEYPRALNK